LSKGVIIQASSNSHGNTAKIVAMFKTFVQFDDIDLKQYNIKHFDYDFNNKDDDFNALFKTIVTSYDVIIFATPVYWYTMSGICKVFLDRISDFLFEEKDFGRKLKGKQMSVISCGSDAKIFEGFDMPFRESANYLNMDYVGHSHTWLEDEKISETVNKNIQEFVKRI
jgi:multimeric flavodoxin WrbA